MDQINEKFQQFLSGKNFVLKKQETDQSWIYQGKLQINEFHMVDFAIQLDKEDKEAIYQIVFTNIAYCRNLEERSKWESLVNELNVEQAGSYYFCIDNDGKVFLRHIGIVKDDLEQLFRILTSAGEVIRQASQKIEHQFGVTVIL
ncbi:hypothetical protein HMPREF2542_06385 [Streptococcus sp. HMSC034B05]|uniref:hypothetical protein n=1 Tax=Streptococcus sp. HMSC034B05 TaxID=1715022 RepID=UPI000797F712|nr:hypothetical protein [Streptococcus sp. HMSC034B05]KXU02189.1 hypothetical protein SCODD09_00625 [Streptococcus constellatus]OFN57279.1 hypothetical protein HMPREF2542_06385 [Streptococcus sp. HMSC034B05]